MLQFLKPGLGAAIFGLRLLVAFAAPPLVIAVFAHEAHPPAQQAATSDESAFLAENEAAMNKMMSAMEAKPSGDIDRDFVAIRVIGLAVHKPSRPKIVLGREASPIG
jgi:hypothetical protein